MHARHRGRCGEPQMKPMNVDKAQEIPLRSSAVIGVICGEHVGEPIPKNQTPSEIRRGLAYI